MGTKGIFGLIRQQFDYGSSFYLEVSSNIQLGPKDLVDLFFRSDVPSTLGIPQEAQRNQTLQISLA